MINNKEDMFSLLIYFRTKLEEVLPSKIFKLWIETKISFDANGAYETNVLLNGTEIYAMPCEWTLEGASGRFDIGIVLA